MRRRFLEDGTIQSLIEADGVRGITSNPSIFQKAIAGSDDYDDAMRILVAAGAETKLIYETLAMNDIQAACDLFADLYASSNGGDGYVSLEVSPTLADDTDGTIAEAKRLFAAVNRPNLMIKVPATPAGIPAIKELIGCGININITLMFNMAHYEAVAHAYIEGLQQLVAIGGDASKVASVASFFVSRVDTAVDNALGEIDSAESKTLLGKIAIANSKVVYQRYKEIFYGDDFAELEAAGANRQRLLWASTGTKNKAYSDVVYVETLIGEETVNTMPPHTIDAFRDHGTAASTLENDVEQAAADLEKLATLGVDLSAITEQLQRAGVESFAKAFETLMAAIDEETAKL